MLQKFKVNVFVCVRVSQGYLVQVAKMSSEEVRMIGDLLNVSSLMYTALTEMLYDQADINDQTESVKLPSLIHPQTLDIHSITTKLSAFTHLILNNLHTLIHLLKV